MLQCVDDTCLVANYPVACQQLLNITDQFLGWSGMKAKLLNCHTMSLQRSTGHIINLPTHIVKHEPPFLRRTDHQFPGSPNLHPSSGVSEVGGWWVEWVVEVGGWWRWGEWWKWVGGGVSDRGGWVGGGGGWVRN